MVLFALFNSADRGRRKNFSHELLQERYDLGEIAYKEYEERKAKVEHVSKAGDWKS